MLRFRSGQVCLVRSAVAVDAEFDAGAMMYLDETGVAKPVSYPQGDLGVPERVTSRFLGIAHQESVVGSSDPVSVDISPLSVYEMDVKKALYRFGDCLFPAGTDKGVLDASVLGHSPTGASSVIAQAMEFLPTSSRVERLRVSFLSAFSPFANNPFAIGNATLMKDRFGSNRETAQEL